MVWWSGLWLNEGFACFMQTWSADKIFPEWQMWNQFVTDDLAAALRLDSLRTSHPIQVPINHAEEVEEVFDAISYSKGACVIRMLNAVLGEDDFRKGLQVYMKRHQYGNTETSDLWRAWEEASGKPIVEIAASWTEQMGFPLLKVERASNDKVKVTQSWFLADGSAVQPNEAKRWTVPIFATSKSTSGTKPTPQIFNTETFEVAIKGANANDWLQVNAGYLVPARVLYSPDLLDKLVEGIR